MSERRRGSLLADLEAARSNVDAVSFRFIAGIISKSQKPTFERQVHYPSLELDYDLISHIVPAAGVLSLPW